MIRSISADIQGLLTALRRKDFLRAARMHILKQSEIFVAHCVARAESLTDSKLATIVFDALSRGEWMSRGDVGCYS